MKTMSQDHRLPLLQEEHSPSSGHVQANSPHFPPVPRNPVTTREKNEAASRSEETVLFLSEDRKCIAVIHQLTQGLGFFLVPTSFDRLAEHTPKSVSAVLVEMPTCPWPFEELSRFLQEILPDVPVVLLDTLERSREERIQMVNASHAYRRLPCHAELLLHDLKLAVERSRLIRNDHALCRSNGLPVQNYDWYGDTSQGRLRRNPIAAYAKLGGSVLIIGERGTYKGPAAQQIHLAGHRSQKPFVPVCCETWTPDILEVALFGCASGGHPDFSGEHVGALEQANGGTVYLDKVEHLPMTVQAKLFRFLKDQTFCRRGDRRPVHADVRIIASTEINLSTACFAGTFREELYHCLYAQPLTLPPLRNEKEDIPELVRILLYHQARQNPAVPSAVSEEAMNKLQCYSWPGNHREFQSVLLRACQAARGGRITERDIVFVRNPVAECRCYGLAGMTLAEVERQLLLETLDANGNNREAAARQLGVSTKTIYNKLKQYKLLDSQKEKRASTET